MQHIFCLVLALDTNNSDKLYINSCNFHLQWATCINTAPCSNNTVIFTIIYILYVQVCISTSLNQKTTFFSFELHKVIEWKTGPCCYQNKLLKIHYLFLYLRYVQFFSWFLQLFCVQDLTRVLVSAESFLQRG